MFEKLQITYFHKLKLMQGDGVTTSGLIVTHSVTFTGDLHTSFSTYLQCGVMLTHSTFTYYEAWLDISLFVREIQICKVSRYQNVSWGRKGGLVQIRHPVNYISWNIYFPSKWVHLLFIIVIFCHLYQRFISRFEVYLLETWKEMIMVNFLHKAR